MKPNEEIITNLMLNNQPGYSEDVYLLMSKSLMGAVLAGERADELSFEYLFDDINTYLAMECCRPRVIRQHYHINKDHRDLRNELREGVEYLLHNVMYTNKHVIEHLYDGVIINNVDVPIITPNRICLMVNGVKLG